MLTKLEVRRLQSGSAASVWVAGSSNPRLSSMRMDRAIAHREEQESGQAQSPPASRLEHLHLLAHLRTLARNTVTTDLQKRHSFTIDTRRTAIQQPTCSGSTLRVSSGRKPPTPENAWIKWLYDR